MRLAWKMVAAMGLAAGFGAAACAQPPAPSSEPASIYPAEPPDGDLAPYVAIGSAVADTINLASAHWSGAQLDAFISGIRANFSGHPVPLDDKGGRILQEMADKQKEAQANPYSPNPEQSRIDQYMVHAREGLKMRQTGSGLLFRVLARGAGPRPRPDDIVLINISAKGPDGATALPQLGARNLRVRVGSLFPGLGEGLQLMTLGGKMVFIIPPQLTFADGKWPDGVDPGIPIWFQVELLDIAPR